MLDKKAIIERIKEIQKRRSILENYVGEPYEEFVEDYEHYNSALHDLQVCLQACLDIAKHIIAAKTFERPEKLKEVFPILAKMKIINQNLAEKLADATGARNILVHSYLKVDPREIYKHIQTDLPDFDQFVSEIGEYLKKEGDEILST